MFKHLNCKVGSIQMLSFEGCQSAVGSVTQLGLYVVTEKGPNLGAAPSGLDRFSPTRSSAEPCEPGRLS